MRISTVNRTPSWTARRALAKLLALTLLLAQAVPVPMTPPAEAVLALYGINDLCRSGAPAGQPAQKCDACCWGHCNASAPALRPESPTVLSPVAWTLRSPVSPTARNGDRRILDAAQARGPPDA